MKYVFLAICFLGMGPASYFLAHSLDIYDSLMFFPLIFSVSIWGYYIGIELDFWGEKNKFGRIFSVVFMLVYWVYPVAVYVLNFQPWMANVDQSGFVAGYVPTIIIPSLGYILAYVYIKKLRKRKCKYDENAVCGLLIKYYLYACASFFLVWTAYYYLADVNQKEAYYCPACKRIYYDEKGHAESFDKIGEQNPANDVPDAPAIHLK